MERHRTLRLALVLALAAPACVGQIVDPSAQPDVVRADAVRRDVATSDARSDGATPVGDAAGDTASPPDVFVPAPDVYVPPPDVYTPPPPPPPPPSCTGSASGTSPIWTCTTDHTARQRCISGGLENEACANGCVSQPTGVDDFCAMPPPPGGGVSCAYPQWWNFPYSWSPGFYAINYWGYHWDNDLAARAGTPVQLRHASVLIEQSVHPWGWEPRFQDTVTGEHFAFLHLQPQHQLTTSVGMTYPAGTLVGYSGGGTTDTGYNVPSPSGGVYSTGAHLCVTTDHSYRTAFPAGTDACM